MDAAGPGMEKAWVYPVSSAVLPDDPPVAARIISAAVAVMADHGYHGTSVREIAAAAGVSSAVIYHYFGSKHGLLWLIMDRGNDKLYALTQAALLAAPRDAASRLSAIVKVHVSRHLSACNEAFLGNTELRSLEPDARVQIIAKRDQLQHMYDQVIHDGVDAKQFGTKHPKEAARAVVTMCSAVSSWYRSGGPLSAEEITSQYTEFSLALVGCRLGSQRRGSSGRTGAREKR